MWEPFSSEVEFSCGGIGAGTPFSCPTRCFRELRARWNIPLPPCFTSFAGSSGTWVFSWGSQSSSSEVDTFSPFFSLLLSFSLCFHRERPNTAASGRKGAENELLSYNKSNNSRVTVLKSQKNSETASLLSSSIPPDCLTMIKIGVNTTSSRGTSHRPSFARPEYTELLSKP